MMKFLGKRALRAKFPKGRVVQVRLLTELDSTIDVEGPVSDLEAGWIVRLAAGAGGAPPLPKAKKARTT
jgi:hypothetical protein